jgi:hypothetical protein
MRTALLGIVTFLLVSSAYALDPKAQKAMMDAMEKAAKTGPEHAMLAELVGNWKTETKMWEEVGKTPTKTMGEAQYTSIMGGRFIEQKVSANMMGQAFEGLGLLGYDNVQKKFIATWCDNFGTTIELMTGTYNEAKKTITLTGHVPDPVTGKLRGTKMTERKVDANTYVHTIWIEKSPGREVKVTEIKYMRKMAPPPPAAPGVPVAPPPPAPPTSPMAPPK